MLQLMHRKKSSLHLELISLMFLQHCEQAALINHSGSENKHLLQRDVGRHTGMPIGPAHTRQGAGPQSESQALPSSSWHANDLLPTFPKMTIFTHKTKLRSGLASKSLVQWLMILPVRDAWAAWENSSREQDTACLLQIYNRKHCGLSLELPSKIMCPLAQHK